MGFDIRTEENAVTRVAVRAREWIAARDPVSPPEQPRIERPSLRPADGACLYIMKCGPFYKVGRATAVVDRLATIQGSCPFDVSLALIVWTTKRACGKAEYAAHQALAAHRHRNEWFRAPYHVIHAAVIGAVEKIEAKLYPRIEWTPEGKVTDLSAMRLPAYGLRPCKKGERPIKGVPRRP